MPGTCYFPKAGIRPTKNLSVNYVDAERYLSEGNDGSGKVVEGEEVEGPPRYLAKLYLRPHYQLEGLTVSLRLVTDLPKSG